SSAGLLRAPPSPKGARCQAGPPPHLPGRPEGPSRDPAPATSRPWTPALRRCAPWPGEWGRPGPAHKHTSYASAPHKPPRFPARPVYYEAYDLLMDARHRERSMKRWRRAWKIELIESFNPEWRDLYFDLNK